MWSGVKAKGKTGVIYSPQGLRRSRVILTMQDAMPLTEVAKISVITQPQNIPVPSELKPAMRRLLALIDAGHR